MDADRLYVSQPAATKAAVKAVEAKQADSYHIKPRRQRNPDRSWDFGFVAVLMKAGRPIGYA